ncbi:hypothetical protein CC1G_03109 [Coprinopsis cinerea okayama7|uniref:C2H2-type domain-containing protein n=1 Tax=Coprinopsis cinerea (strain Okayama-7 / 130 / ATCC MYA-4618 / FGSC 9003) TaxID=240176 RepID=A8PEZ1_COPC7|nr:hypothetical protein CC1G_03109 [Coprinopsis cinerea okayama7\|eukprot:XP_001840880.2 hypothetical protein CC1G_03109 [Coprinopsis cinerea okayama7\
MDSDWRELDQYLALNDEEFAAIFGSASGDRVGSQSRTMEPPVQLGPDAIGDDVSPPKGIHKPSAHKKRRNRNRKRYACSHPGCTFSATWKAAMIRHEKKHSDPSYVYVPARARQTYSRCRHCGSFSKRTGHGLVGVPVDPLHSQWRGIDIPGGQGGVQGHINLNQNTASSSNVRGFSNTGVDGFFMGGSQNLPIPGPQVLDSTANAAVSALALAPAAPANQYDYVHPRPNIVDFDFSAAPAASSSAAGPSFLGWFESGSEPGHPLGTGHGIRAPVPMQGYNQAQASDLINSDFDKWLNSGWEGVAGPASGAPTNPAIMPAETHQVFQQTLDFEGSGGSDLYGAQQAPQMGDTTTSVTAGDQQPQGDDDLGKLLEFFDWSADSDDGSVQAS